MARSWWPLFSPPSAGAEDMLEGTFVAMDVAEVDGLRELQCCALRRALKLTARASLT